MREELFGKVTMVCPACRRMEKKSSGVHTLELSEVFKKENGFVLEGFLKCSNPKCAALYPVVSGVPIIMADMGKWWESSGDSLCKANIDSAEIQGFFRALEESQTSRISQMALLGTYMESHYGDMSGFSRFGLEQKTAMAFRRAVQQAMRPADGRKYRRSLDIGCSVGGHTFEAARYSELAVGLDNFFPAVRKAAEIQRKGRAEFFIRRRGRVFEKVSEEVDAPENAMFLVSDALDPPFEAEAFDWVVALNLVENVNVPLILLGQMNALLESEGSLMFSSPYEWREDFSEPVEWLESAEMDAATLVKSILRGEVFPMTGFSYEITEERSSIPWVLGHHDRYCSLYLVHLLKARKLN